MRTKQEIKNALDATMEDYGILENKISNLPYFNADEQQLNQQLEAKAIEISILEWILTSN